MKIFGFNISKEKTTMAVPPKSRPQISASNGNLFGSYTVSFDGEKTAGEIGPAINYNLNYSGLRTRSWQSYLESEISRTIFDRFTIWIIDKGLKLQCEPAKLVLQSENVEFDAEKFNSITEARFNLFAKSKRASFNGMQSLNEIATETFKSSKIGGDGLVIIRYINGEMKVEFIDGAHIDSPILMLHAVNKNRIINGVEIDDSGKHIAYHIPGDLNNKSRRIEAWSQTTGLRMAFLVYGSKYRSDNLRGIPSIATSLETLAKIDRYKEAAVGGAEERQKIPYVIEHDVNSDGENPLGESLAIGLGHNTDQKVGAYDETGQPLTNAVAATTQKMVVNMPVGSKLKSMDSKQELHFKEFYNTNADIICAALGIPPNVAWSVYNDSFSASRAATKDWEHTIDVERNKFQVQFYEPIFDFWLFTEILKKKIDAPKFMEAFKTNKFDIVESYQNVRFTGPMFPHIDPLKEAKAEREKLGEQFRNVPLTTLERATEMLNGGDANSNVEQASKELEVAEELGFDTKPENVQNNDLLNSD